MDRRTVVMGMVSAGLGAPGIAAALPESTTSRVRALADAYAAAWNASDMDAMARLYAPEVHWVNIVGMHWRGKAEVDRAHRAFFDIMFRGVPLQLEEVESTRSLPGGAIIAVLRWAVGAFKTPVGQQVPPSRDRMTLILVPERDRLLIAHGANIQIDEKAQRSDPIPRSS